MRLFLGSEGTFGIITEATMRITRLPETRLFRALLFKDVATGLEAGRRMMVDRLDPLVIRMYDPHSTASLVKRVLGYELAGAYMIIGFDGWREIADGAGSAARCRSATSSARATSAREPGERWWNHRYDFYYPPHTLHLPAMYGTVETVATFDNIEAHLPREEGGDRRRVRPSRRRVHRPLLALVPVGREPLRSVPARRTRRPIPSRRAGAARSDLGRRRRRRRSKHGGMINEHHGVGLKLQPLHARAVRIGVAAARGIKRRDRSERHHESRQGRLRTGRPRERARASESARRRRPRAAATAGCAGTCARSASSRRARRYTPHALGADDRVGQARRSSRGTRETADVLYACADCGLCRVALRDRSAAARCDRRRARRPGRRRPRPGRRRRRAGAPGALGQHPRRSGTAAGAGEGPGRAVRRRRRAGGGDAQRRRGAAPAGAGRPRGGRRRRRSIDRARRERARLRRHGEDARGRGARRRRGVRLPPAARPRSRRPLRVRSRLRVAARRGLAARASASAKRRPRWPRRTPAARCGSSRRRTACPGPTRSPTTPSGSATGRGPASSWPPRSAPAWSAARCAGTSGRIRAAPPAASI